MAPCARVALHRDPGHLLLRRLLGCARAALHRDRGRGCRGAALALPCTATVAGCFSQQVPEQWIAHGCAALTMGPSVTKPPGIAAATYSPAYKLRLHVSAALK